MKEYQRSYIQFCLDHQVLQFGTFTLKSGRVSPYFFNTANLYTGATLTQVAEFYAQAILDRPPPYPTVLFGPAYKGIPLSVATSMQLTNHHGHLTAYCFNRKEIKDHGEGGRVVGAPLLDTSHVLVIDDVLTSGKAVREIWPLLTPHQGSIVGIQVALDRQELGTLVNGSGMSAIEEVKRDLNVNVYAIITLSDILEYLTELGGYEKECQSIQVYLNQYGITQTHDRVSSST